MMAGTVREVDYSSGEVTIEVPEVDESDLAGVLPGQVVVMQKFDLDALIRRRLRERFGVGEEALEGLA